MLIRSIPSNRGMLSIGVHRRELSLYRAVENKKVWVLTLTMRRPSNRYFVLIGYVQGCRGPNPTYRRSQRNLSSNSNTSHFRSSQWPYVRESFSFFFSSLIYIFYYALFFFFAQTCICPWSPCRSQFRSSIRFYRICFRYWTSSAHHSIFTSVYIFLTPRVAFPDTTRRSWYVSIFNLSGSSFWSCDNPQTIV